MIECPICSLGFHSENGVNQHIRKYHNKERIQAPDLVGLGIMKRKLTRKESKDVTNDVMKLGIKDNDLRFKIAVIKSIEKVA